MNLSLFNLKPYLQNSMRIHKNPRELLDDIEMQNRIADATNMVKNDKKPEIYENMQRKLSTQGLEALKRDIALLAINHNTPVNQLVDKHSIEFYEKYFRNYKSPS